VETTVLGGEEDVSFRVQSFQGVIDANESISSAMDAAVQKIKLDKASVEFGLEMAIESGELTALLVKGSGTANLKISLECWCVIAQRRRYCWPPAPWHNEKPVPKFL
jgi:hypothetical protein